MRFREYPLLNAPNLVVIILRQGAAAPATLADCAATLGALLDRADEHPPFGPEDVAARLEMLIGYLTEAKLLLPVDGGFVTTARGKAALEEHPEGLDTADLMVYPEFARYIRGLDLRRGAPGLDPHLDPRAGGYDRGFHAYWSGETPSDNPYPADTADHLAWENGWSEGLDEDVRRTGSAPRS